MANTSERTNPSEQPRLPEVCLGWSDFKWSLEKLRHNPYGKTSRERDWFRVNPLEIVLLGTQSLNNNPATKDNGTMVLVMASLRDEMALRPRYWERLLEVLFHTMEGKEVPPSILQRCISSLMSLWKVLENFPEFKPSMYARTIAHFEIVKTAITDQEKYLGVPLSSELQNFLNNLKDLASSSLESCSSLADSKDILQCLCQEVCSGHEISLELSIQVNMILKCPRKKFNEIYFHQSQSNFQKLVSTIKLCTANSSSALSKLMCILQLLVVRSSTPSEEMNMATSDTPSTSLATSDTPSTSVEFSSNFDAPKDGVEEMEEAITSRQGAVPLTKTPLEELFDSLTSTFIQLKEFLAPHQSDLCDVSDEVLHLAQVILAYKPLSDSIAEAALFFHNPMTLLLSYSTEGYLTDSPNEFLIELLRFISSLIEEGTPPLQALQINLPNLFGPAFGIQHHKISCKLLEYGYLATCSQHQKSLLTEGLKFLMKVFHLFRPIDVVRGEERARRLRVEAVEISTSLLEDLILSLPLGGESLLEEENGNEGGPHASKMVSEASLRELEFGFSQIELASDAEREADKDLRFHILLHLLELACAMIRNGDNISFLYASCLPKLLATPKEPTHYNQHKLSKFFGEEPPAPSSGISWNVDIKKLAVLILELSTLCLKNGATSPFQLCGIVVPKLIKNLNNMHFADDEKLSITMEILKTTQEMLETGHDIEHFISYGIDLMSQLLPPTASSEELTEFLSQMAGHFVTSNQGALLYLIKNSCSFMLKAFTDEADEIRELFRVLLFKGKRDEIRFIFKICNQQLAGEQYRILRQYLYGYASGKLNHRQMTALCELLISAMDIARFRKAVREVISNVEEEDMAVLKERENMEMAVLTKLISPCLAKVENALQSNIFKKEVWENASLQLSRIALFRTLFQSEFHTFSEYSEDEMLAAFQRKFPDDVLSCEDTMQLLSLSATRIEHMQTPRYDSLKKLLSSFLCQFLAFDVGTEELSGSASEQESRSLAPLTVRMKQLQNYMDDLPRNKEDKERLLTCGYNKDIWSERVLITVRTDGSLSLEENMRQNLLACYTEFADILKQMAITHVSVDGEMIKVVDLFTDQLSLVDLKGRRAIAVRVIDQRRGGETIRGHFYERKAALLAKEDQIEAEFEKMVTAAIKPKTFTAALNTGFFDCSRCCGPKIIGCYAPSGEHCERPLEIGMRCDSAMASIYDEAEQEIENAEMLFTEEGVFLFKAYTNGHPYNTSQVWLQLFAAMLKEESSSSSSLVPAIIIPRGYPNQRTWEALRRIQSVEMTGSLLTCRPDFSPEWRSYYDHRPERVQIGTDMILHCNFSVNADQSRPTLQRQRSKFTKDLAGIIFEDVMQDLLSNDWLKQFRFLGKVMSQYISVCVGKGEGESKLFSAGFDYKRWTKTFSKAKDPPPLPVILALGSLKEGLPTKEAIVGHLVEFLDEGILKWCAGVDLVELCVSSHKQLLELKRFLEMGKGVFHQPGLLKQLRDILARCTTVVPILSLPEALQEEIIHWIFQNEDRVWRYRGGRGGHETLQQFMNFLGRPLPGYPVSNECQPSDQEHQNTDKGRVDPYAGVAVFCLPHLVTIEGAKFDPTTVQVGQMVAYAVGEVLPSKEEEEEEGTRGKEGQVTRWAPLDSDSCYEVVTTWVHPNYRGLNLSVQMYLMIVQQAPAHLMMCDLLEGSVERIIHSSWILQLLDRMRVSGFILQKRQQSYTVLTQAGGTEQFEQVVISSHRLRVALSLYGAALWVKTHPKATSFFTIATATALPIILYAMLKLRHN